MGGEPPVLQSHLSGTFQVCSKSINEILGWYILHGLAIIRRGNCGHGELCVQYLTTDDERLDYRSVGYLRHRPQHIIRDTHMALIHIISIVRMTLLHGAPPVEGRGIFGAGRDGQTPPLVVSLLPRRAIPSLQGHVYAHEYSPRL